MIANMHAASVLGLIGTHCAEVAPVTDRCGSICTRLAPRTRASACRITAHGPPVTSLLLPNERLKRVYVMSADTVNARCQNSPNRCSECTHLTPCPEPKL